MITATDQARCFNPRSREGSDSDVLLTSDNMLKVSIHAPAKGATILFIPIMYGIGMFQSTLPRRERPYVDGKIKDLRIVSIHAPAKGATR